MESCKVFLTCWSSLDEVLILTLATSESEIKGYVPSLV